MKEVLFPILKKHLARCQFPEAPAIVLEPPKVKDHGDWSTNAALVLAKGLGRAPREIAEVLAESLREETDSFAKVEVKGPGFLNLFLHNALYYRAVNHCVDASGQLKLPRSGAGKRILVEFVSANPTGPMHVGHGRNAVVGDCLSRLFEAVGYEVVREFYVNDHGVQIQTLGKSGAHYHLARTQVGGVVAELPEDMYRGAYLQELVERHEAEIAPVRDQPLRIGKILGVALLQAIREDLARLEICFDHYFSESSLYEAGQIDSALEALRQKGHTFEQDGALWFKSTDFGDDKDRVLIKGDNTYTYFTPDIAYHKNKMERGFDLYVNVMGADHGGYVPRLKAGVEALGYDPDKLEVLLMQMVSLRRGEERVAMSKRSGDYVTLREVVEEVGKDATRFFFMLRSHNAALDFDLELAKRESSENPVYYVQYAHARLCSLFQKAQQAGYEIPKDFASLDLSPLQLPEELELIKVLLTYGDVLENAAQLREPHRVAFYLLELTKVFQNYYTRAKSDERYRILSGELQGVRAKLALLGLLRQVLCSGLGILGVSAPERMNREDAP